MTDVNRRLFVAALYDGPHWKTKVGNMSDEQVYAIWAKEQEKPPPEDEPKQDNQDDIPF